MIARGRDVRSPDPLLRVLAGVEDPTAQTVQGEVLRLFCARAGYGVATREEEGAFVVSLTAA